MNDYTKPEYKNLYQEILKDYNWTWGKFSPIPYPLMRKDLEQSNNLGTSLPSVSDVNRRVS